MKQNPASNVQKFAPRAAQAVATKQVTVNVPLALFEFFEALAERCDIGATAGDAIFGMACMQSETNSMLDDPGESYLHVAYGIAHGKAGNFHPDESWGIDWDACKERAANPLIPATLRFPNAPDIDFELDAEDWTWAKRAAAKLGVTVDRVFENALTEFLQARRVVC